MQEDRTAALKLSKGLAATASNIERVGRATSPVTASWAFTQWELRKRAAAKFERAEEMLFTREPLEQASHEAISAYHGALFPEGALVADLTAGIGADLIALARRGPAIGFEIDSGRAEFARHNLAVHGLDAEIRLADCLAADWNFDYAFADPARRVGGARTLSAEAFSPNPFDLAKRMNRLKLGAMKLSPMLPDALLSGLAPYQAFLSLGRECREALLVLGQDAPSRREAVHLESDCRLPSGALPPRVEIPGAFLFEADPAAIRADALGVLASEFKLTGLGDSNGYLTGPLRVESCWLRPYEVLGYHRADVAKTKKLLRELGSGTPTVKSRAGIDTIRLQKELKLEGSGEFAVAVYPVGKTLWHAVLRVPHPE